MQECLIINDVVSLEKIVEVLERIKYTCLIYDAHWKCLIKYNSSKIEFSSTIITPSIIFYHMGILPIELFFFSEYL